MSRFITSALTLSAMPMTFYRIVVDATITATSTSDGPKVTDWMSVTIAAVALLIASVAAYFNWRTNRHQAKQLDNLETESRNRQEQEKQRQASHVWAVMTPGGSVEIRNESGLPVYDIDPLVDPTGLNVKIPRVQYLDPAPDRKTKVVDNSKRQVREAAVKRAEITHGRESIMFDDAVTALLETARSNGVEITFRDSSNNWWRRSPKGELSEHQNSQ